jgi:hypothetical protein
MHIEILERYRLAALPLCLIRRRVCFQYRQVATWLVAEPSGYIVGLTRWIARAGGEPGRAIQLCA